MTKLIENKTTQLVKSEKGDMFDYSDLLLHVFNIPVTEGISIKDMKEDMDILTILQSENKKLEFTEHQFNRIKDLVEKSVWAVRHKDIVDFVNYIEVL